MTDVLDPVSDALGSLPRGHEPSVPKPYLVNSWTPQRNRNPLTIRDADGIYLWDTEGKRYADFCSAQVSVNVGYKHPAVIEAIERQLQRAAYIAPVFQTEPEQQLAALVARHTPDGLNHVFFTNTGAEGVETAIKVARAVTGRLKIYSAWQSYHGATSGASAVSGDPRRLFAESGMVGHAKFHLPLDYRSPFGSAVSDPTGEIALATLASQLEHEGAETVAAILIEPIVGTSGGYVPPAAFVSGLRRLCDHLGVLLIVDETMSGWGRTGRWFACEHFGLHPDILVTAKGITSGYVPLGCVVMTTPIYDHFLDRPFVSGSTTEGHALGCAAGIANIGVYEDEDLIHRAAVQGDRLLAGLRSLQTRHRCIGDVRGKGLLTCVELTSDRSTRAPLAGYRNAQRDIAGPLNERLLASGLSVLCKWDFVFIAPALIVQDAEIDDALNRLDDAFSFVDEAFV